jgi:hypothetical protein
VPPDKTGAGMPQKKESTHMIVYKNLNLNHIYEQGKNFPWIRPRECLRCKNDKLWGHGFASRFFDGFMQALFMKCYRCPECGCVITLRPETHFRWIQAPIAVILSAITCRVQAGRWPAGGSASRKRHWLFNLRNNIKAHLANTWDQGDVAGFARLQALGIVPVSVGIVWKKDYF